MVSINNTANASVLASLRQINNDISMSQTRIGTGRKVNSASDNSTVWKMAQGIRSDLKTQDSLSSGIAVAKGKADSAVAALNTMSDLLGQIKTIAQDATSNTPTDSYASAIAKIGALQSQITATMSSATFQGENWLNGAGASKTVNISVSGGTPVTASVTTIKLDTAAAALPNALAAATSATIPDLTATGVAALVDLAQTAISSYQSTLSSFSSALGAQQDFLASLKSIRETALGSLVDADLTEESAKVTALQTQQQLAYQALSIGNSSAQNILRLFQ